jgi:hypothetical protein
MVAWCETCKRYVNQYCDKDGENFGINACEKYACGGTMVCPICGGNDLLAKKPEPGLEIEDLTKDIDPEALRKKREEMAQSGMDRKLNVTFFCDKGECRRGYCISDGKVCEHLTMSHCN